MLDLGADSADPESMKAWGRERSIRASVLQGLLADQVQPRGVQLRGVRISGPLDLEAATVRCPLRLDHCYLDAPTVLNYATVSILALTGCLVVGLTGEALTVTHELDLSGSRFTAAVLLSGAQITGSLKLSDARLEGANPQGNALIADDLKVGRNVYLDRGFSAAGAVSLVGTDITGNLECEGATLNGTDDNGNTVIADNLKVGHDALLRNGFTTAGAVSLLGADITGNLECDGATLNRAGPKRLALVADSLKVSGAILFRNGFTTAVGGISLIGADIAGNVDLSGAALNGTDTDDNALVADNLKVGHDALLRDGFTAAGAISLLGATITGDLDFNGAELGGANEAGSALIGDNLEHPATAGQRLSWIQSQYRDKPPVRWRDVLLRRKADPAPDPGPMFAAQPYEKLASVYQQGGQDKEARIIALARRRDIRKYGDLTWYRKALNWLLDWTIQYGYKTWRAVLALALVYVAALVIFWIAQHHANLIVPVMDTTSGPVPTALHCKSSYPCFYPAGYAIDVVVPIINVHQDSYRAPNGHAPWGTVLTVFSWLDTAFGWALATLAVAGYTGLARSSDTL
jgi:hypothetical protein